MTTNLIAISGKKGSGKSTVAKIIKYLLFIEEHPDNSTYYPIDNFKSNLVNITNSIDDKLEGYWKIKPFATPIKQIASIMTGIPVEKMESQEDKEVVLGDEWNNIEYEPDGINGTLMTKFEYKYTLRQLLQLIGDIMLQIHPDWLLNVMFRDYKSIVGYAPGNYHCKCGNCGIYFDGDKKAVKCEKCSIFYPKLIIPDLRKQNEYNKIRELGGKCIRVVKIGQESNDIHVSETGLDHISDWDYIIEAEHGDIESLIRQVKEMLIKLEIL